MISLLQAILFRNYYVVSKQHVFMYIFRNDSWNGINLLTIILFSPLFSSSSSSFSSSSFFSFIPLRINVHKCKWSSVFFADRYVDLFTVPTHYLVEDDESYRTFHPSRLMGLFDMFNADSLIDLISGLGAPKRKILVSVPSSAFKFTLKDRDDNAPSAPTEEMQPIVIDQKQV